MAQTPKQPTSGTKRSRAVPRKKAAAKVARPPTPEEAPEFVTPTDPWPVRVEYPSVGYWMKAAAGVIVVIALANMVVAISHVLILILISLILSIGVQPGVNWLVLRGMRRGSAVAAIFVIGAVVVLGFLAMITPAIINQIGQLVEQAPERIREAQESNKFIADLNERFDLTGKLTNLADNLPSTALSLVRSFTSFVFNLLTVVILTLYFSTALPKMEIGIARLLRRENREEFSTILEESTSLVGGYMIGNLVVSVIAGGVSFVALLLIGVPYPAALAFWVALTDLIPTVGAILGALAAVLVAAFAGVPELVGTVIFFTIYQQIENYVIAPRVMTRTVEMSAA
ncbi:MAG TPA: AI-2E family transporter, partial [Actinomycetota bacterium]|nr:AI-2E family transporter [Actinomycetota bacterium]